jgi:hypothetical protein
VGGSLHQQQHHLNGAAENARHKNCYNPVCGFSALVGKSLQHPQKTGYYNLADTQLARSIA